MNTELSQVFKNMSQLEPSMKLKGLILRRIEVERTKQIRRKLIFSYSGMAASFSAAVYTLIYFGSAFFKSEFWSLFSLIFSDIMIVAGNWKTYLYSLLETLPVVNLALILIPLLGLLLSIGFYLDLRNRNNQFSPFGKGGLRGI